MRFAWTWSGTHDIGDGVRAPFVQLFAIAAFFLTHRHASATSRERVWVCFCWRSLFTAGAAVAVTVAAAAAACHPSHATALSIQFSCGIDTYTYIRTKWNEMRLLPTIPKWLHLHTNQAEQQQTHRTRIEYVSHHTRRLDITHKERKKRIFYLLLYRLCGYLHYYNTITCMAYIRLVSIEKLYFRESFILLAFFSLEFSFFTFAIHFFVCEVIFLQFFFKFYLSSLSLLPDSLVSFHLAFFSRAIRNVFSTFSRLSYARVYTVNAKVREKKRRTKMCDRKTEAMNTHSSVWKIISAWVQKCAHIWIIRTKKEVVGAWGPTYGRLHVWSHTRCTNARVHWLVLDSHLGINAFLP